MKKLIFLISILVCWFLWLSYSNPARYKFKKESYQSAPYVTPISEIWRQDTLQNRPIWLKGYVSSSISTKFAGFFVLEDHQSDLLILSHGITPAQGRLVYVLVIPREVLMIQDKELLVAALIQYRYVDKVRVSPASKKIASKP